jgi:hypothetical protein
MLTTLLARPSSLFQPCLWRTTTIHPLMLPPELHEESKAVYRNRQEEAADPDFQRNVVVYPQQAYPPAYPVAPQQQIAAAAPMMMYPSTIFTPASSSPATAYYNHYPPPAAVPTTTTKSHDLTADAPAFYPSFGQQQQQL